MKQLVAFLIGLVLAYVHWIGIIIGGFLVGYTAKNVKVAIACGFAFGVVLWIFFAAYMASAGLLGKYTAMGLLFQVSVLLPLIASTLSASLKSIFA
jgi:uncharacterized membrane protein (UPF0136 family)